MKNKKFEHNRRTAKAFAKRQRPRQLVQGIDIIYVHDGVKAMSSDDFGFRLGSQWVMVNWIHPHCEYASKLEELAWDAVESFRPAYPDFNRDSEPIYEPVGRSRKKVKLYQWKPATDAVNEYLIRFDNEFARLKSEAPALTVVPTLRVEQTHWCRRVDICYPVELCSENDVVEFAHLIRRHLRGEIDIMATVKGYQYVADDYAIDQQGSIVNGRGEYEQAQKLATLGDLADSAKAAADRASKSIDETLRFVEESNKRIQGMENRK